MPFVTVISTTDLMQHLIDPSWLIIDCRHDLANPEAGYAAYEHGHIPGARFAHLDRDLSDQRRGPNGEFRGRHPLPERHAFIDILRRLGVNNDSQVVVYDAHGGMFAARLWWMLRWVGHKAVAVLDGGLSAWLAQGHQLSTEISSAACGNLTAKSPLTTTVNVDDVLVNLVQPTRVVVDARAPDRFRGENETLDAVGGHIPGAKNRFFKDNLQADGKFKSAEQLRVEFGALIASPQHSIMQCGSGVTACHNLLAMEVAGLSGAALYPGSWSEWCSDSSRPVAQ